ncbi:UDP-glucose 4-epimerase GalE [Winogradskyella haliclonae]|uniref:UDP-glucose 4-epimerase n=1 Tax=Winogradskyella haliclonae TaxID=2048558 RepID=A0ABQ2BXW6_9FLAO|nr:UDP-glucose 4-epimerase GalE [Winogradskyella haliclonae]GGI56632.1 UDP-glucose 4-epimerase [Winogradskyella haliclonae]
MKVLVTGGLGYIGSHTVVELQLAGYDVVIIDNLSNSTTKVLEGITKITGVTPEFQELDLRCKDKVQYFFEQHQGLDGVVHFAASKAVGESVENPLFYYENNVATLIYVLQELQKLKQQNFIFSSSCTVYGEADKHPIDENSAIKPAQSPYGNTKQIGEEILKDSCKINSNLKTIALRYFNPIGAHDSSNIGELPIGIPQNLVPYITQTAIGQREQLSVFGDDYPTEDGTCVRDYIHVVDVAKAHVVALERLINNEQDSNFDVFNIGTGKGSSVLEVIYSFERVSGQKLNYKIAHRRKGDVVAAFADTSKANSKLGWKAKYTLDDAMSDAWKWEQKLRTK